MDFNFVNPAITVFIYFIAEFAKKFILKTDKQKRWLPFICAIMGIVIAIVIYIVYPIGSTASNVVEAFATGALSGFAATGFNQLYKQFARYSGQMYIPEGIYGNVDFRNRDCNCNHCNNSDSTSETNNNSDVNYGNEDGEDQSKNE